jgi:hypothetical protein
MIRACFKLIVILIFTLPLNTHAEDKYYSPYDFGKAIQIDLNGDNITDSVMIISLKNIEQEVDGFTIKVNNQFLEGTCQMIGPKFFIADIDKSDRFLEIAIEEDGPSDDPKTTFYRYDKTINKLGTVEGNSQHFLSKDRFSVKGDGIIRTKDRGHILHTWWFDSKYKIGNNKISFVEKKFIDMNLEVTLLEDLPIYKGTNDREVLKILKKSEHVKIRRTDDKSWCEIEAPDGIKGWIELKGNSWVKNCNNKYSSLVFKGLFFAD